MKKPKVLFLLKEALGYNGTAVPSKGLFNSATFVVNALRLAGIEARLVEVIDANDIDREVTRYRPTHCIVEALWVLPDKLFELKRLHPRVTFVVRIHSKTPFLASEGIAIDWLRNYPVAVAFNALAAARELGALVKQPFWYLPNIYQPIVDPSQKKLVKGPNVWVGCLGAIRPLKNQLAQAIAAMHCAEETKRRLYFHVNDRIEQGGESILKNLRALFKGTPHQLIEHAWRESHESLLSIVAGLDISMQVSFSETFNIATADAVWRGVPVVVSREVEWIARRYAADPNSVSDMVRRLGEAERAGLRGTKKNLESLRNWNAAAMRDWGRFLKETL